MQVNNLQEFKDYLSEQATGLTKQQALHFHICSQCRNQPEFYSDAGRKEYSISGLCEFCFDIACDPDICRNCQTPYSWHKYGKTTCEKFVVEV